jgi:hypothetical protein
MRRLLVLTSVILLAAGCSTDKSGEATAAPAPASGGSAPAAGAPAASAPVAGGAATNGGAKGGDAALKGNTAAICNQAAKTSGDFAATFAQNLKLQIDAASAKDAVAAQKAEQKSLRDVQNYSYALTDMSKLAADKAVSQALGDMGKQVGAFKADISAIDEEKLAGLRATLDKACGKA